MVENAAAAPREGALQATVGLSRLGQAANRLRAARQDLTYVCQAASMPDDAILA